MNTAVLVIGEARSGKDTIAEYLREHWGFKRSALADYLRDRVKDFDPHVSFAELVNGGPAKDKYRPFLLDLGSLIRKHFPGSPFAHKLARHMAHIPADRDYGLVVPDTRYQDEVECFRRELPTASWQVLTIGVIRPDNPGIGDHANHETERGARAMLEAGFPDVTIINNGTIPELHRAVQTVMIEYQKGKRKWDSPLFAG